MNNLWKNNVNNVEFISLLKKFLKEFTGRPIFYEVIEQENDDKIQIAYLANISTRNQSQTTANIEIHIFSNKGSDILELEQVTNALFNKLKNGNFYLDDTKTVSIRVLDINQFVINNIEETSPNVRRRDLDIECVVNY